MTTPPDPTDGTVRLLVNGLESEVRVDRRIVPGQPLDTSALNPIRRHPGIHSRGEFAHSAYGAGIGVDRPYLEAVPQEIRKVAPVTAAGVEQAATPIEAAAQQLVEQVDVDLAKLGA